MSVRKSKIPEGCVEINEFYKKRAKIIALAKKRGIRIKHNDTSKAKPLSEIGGTNQGNHK